ncbi:M23 family metallopeptidase [Mycolicibacterium frederiksbergense]
MKESTLRFARSSAVIALALLCTVATTVAAPAHADASATVKARTQRMSAPNLNSTQSGWYNPGDRLTLVCSTRGQAVKGYFSFNIPNGGWDNLWYKTSDGHFVADVDIETGTLDAVARDCSAPAANPAPANPAPAPAPAGFRVPLDGAPALSRGFGNGHNGIDYRVNPGTPVYASEAGVVTFEGHGHHNSWMTWMAGICVLIKHADKYTGYAHLSRTVINNGQQVSKGQFIGYTGSTGASSGPHLHFEMLPLSPNFNDRNYFGRIDPAPFLR